MGLRENLRNNEKVYNVFTYIIRNFSNNKVSIGKNNIINLKGVRIKKSHIKIFGENNIIEISPHSTLVNNSIVIKGNGCHISIGSCTAATNLDIICEDDNNKVIIGSNTIITGYTHLAVTEGRSINIGNDALFSNDIIIRTGDSHAIYQNDIRINKSDDVKIGDHVWVGNKVIILKGSEIGNGSVVGSGSVVTRKFNNNIVLAGNPAREIKRDIIWKFDRNDTT